MNRNTPEDLVNELLSSNRSIAQDTMEDGFTTLHTKEGVPYIANLDPEEKARYSETKIPLSKIKKDGKGEKELTTGKKDKKADTDSNLTDLQKKIKALTEGKEYTEEVANKVGDVMRQELEKNKEFTDFMDKLDLKDKLNEEIKSLNLIDIYQPLKEAQNKIREYMNGVHERLWTYGGSWDSKKDPEYQKLSENYDKAYIEAQEERYQRLSEKMGLKVEDVKQSFVKSNDIAEKMIGIFKNQFKDVIDFNQNEKIKCPKNLTENIDKGLALYSKDFVKTMKDNGVECVKFNGRRAYYRNFDKTVHVDKRDSLGTVAHEFAHALEHNEPVILKIEEEFYNRRTKGEKNVSLSRVTNAPYGRSEVTKLDKFIDPYMGKYYKSGDAYELLSMGMTEIYENPNRLLKDKDYTNFVLGCLAYKKGNR